MTINNIDAKVWVGKCVCGCEGGGCHMTHPLLFSATPRIASRVSSSCLPYPSSLPSVGPPPHLCMPPPQVGDLRERIFPDFLAWFANYLVVKRAAQEANYHTLYVSLCDKVKRVVHWERGRAAVSADISMHSTHPPHLSLSVTPCSLPTRSCTAC